MALPVFFMFISDHWGGDFGGRYEGHRMIIWPTASAVYGCGAGVHPHDGAWIALARKSAATSLGYFQGIYLRPMMLYHSR